MTDPLNPYSIPVVLARTRDDEKRAARDVTPHEPSCGVTSRRSPVTVPVGNDYTGGSCCPPYWTYRPGDVVYVVHPGGAGSWTEKQPEAPAWSWLGETPRGERP